MQLIDTHCHLDVAEFNTDREQVIARAAALGVTRIVVPAIVARSWESLLDLCAAHDGLYPALGLHPVFLEQHTPGDVDALRDTIERQPPLAVGEIGLDFYIKGLERARQLDLFETQLRVARDAGLPVLLHVRKAHDEVLAALRDTPVPGGIAHAFNGSMQQAARYLELGFKLGFGGTMTYPGSRKIRQLARDLPAEAIVLETDAPDIVVAAHRGAEGRARNSPEYLVDCLRALAEIRATPEDEIAAITTANALAVLGLAA